MINTRWGNQESAVKIEFFPYFHTQISPFMTSVTCRHCQVRREALLKRSNRGAENIFQKRIYILNLNLHTYIHTYIQVAVEHVSRCESEWEFRVSQPPLKLLLDGKCAIKSFLNREDPYNGHNGSF